MYYYPLSLTIKIENQKPNIKQVTSINRTKLLKLKKKLNLVIYTDLS